MRTVLPCLTCALGAALALSLLPARGQEPATGKAMEGPGLLTLPADIKWGPAPPLLPAGAQAAVLEGNPMTKGEYTLRLKMPDGYRVPAHWHSKTEHVTVISGTFHLGMGDTLDTTKGMTMPAGAFGYMPPKMRHYAWAEGETVVQVHGSGPFDITYVNPADDPRNDAKSNTVKK
jgi:hypothetical protein